MTALLVLLLIVGAGLLSLALFFAPLFIWRHARRAADAAEKTYNETRAMRMRLNHVYEILQRVDEGAQKMQRDA